MCGSWCHRQVESSVRKDFILCCFGGGDSCWQKALAVHPCGHCPAWPRALGLERARPSLPSLGLPHSPRLRAFSHSGPWIVPPPLPPHSCLPLPSIILTGGPFPSCRRLGGSIPHSPHIGHEAPTGPGPGHSFLPLTPSRSSLLSHIWELREPWRLEACLWGGASAGHQPQLPPATPSARSHRILDRTQLVPIAQMGKLRPEKEEHLAPCHTRR